MTPDDNNLFWRWSLASYEYPGVKNRLIYLQDSFGFDVNLTLWCCWRGACGETLSEDALRTAQGASEGWQNGVVEPIREARRNAKDSPPAFYARIKEIELAAEHREQDVLFALSGAAGPAASHDDAIAASKANLGLYASLLDAPRRDGYSSALLRDLIDHIFPPDRKDESGTHT